MSQATETTTTTGCSTTPTETVEGGALLTLTERAIAKVKQFAQSMEGAEGKALRIFVQGGGCSGFQYGFTFDDKHETDTLIEAGDVKVLVDPQSVPHLKNATVDFIEDFRGAGFSVINPNATGGCGCGKSFSA